METPALTLLTPKRSQHVPNNRPCLCAASWQYIDFFGDCVALILAVFYAQRLDEQGAGVALALYYVSARIYAVLLKLLGPCFGLEYGEWRSVAMVLSRLHRAAGALLSMAGHVYTRKYFNCTLLQVRNQHHMDG